MATRTADAGPSLPHKCGGFGGVQLPAGRAPHTSAAKVFRPVVQGLSPAIAFVRHQGPRPVEFGPV